MGFTSIAVLADKTKVSESRHEYCDGATFVKSSGTDYLIRAMSFATKISAK